MGPSLDGGRGDSKSDYDDADDDETMTDDSYDDTYGDYDDNHDDDDDFINLSSSQPEANHSYLQQQPR